MACASSEDSDQPGHPPSLIRVFAVRMKKAWVLSYPLSAQQGCKNAGKYAYFPCHWYLPAFMAFMANMVANMAYMVNSMDSYQI